MNWINLYLTFFNQDYPKRSSCALQQPVEKVVIMLPVVGAIVPVNAPESLAATVAMAIVPVNAPESPAVAVAMVTVPVNAPENTAAAVAMAIAPANAPESLVVASAMAIVPVNAPGNTEAKTCLTLGITIVLPGT